MGSVELQGLLERCGRELFFKSVGPRGERPRRMESHLKAMGHFESPSASPRVLRHWQHVTYAPSGAPASPLLSIDVDNIIEIIEVPTGRAAALQFRLMISVASKLIYADPLRSDPLGYRL